MNSTEPKIIYLQIGEENTTEDFSDEKEYLDGSVSWCIHKIYGTDIEYISKSYLVSLIDEMIEEYDLIESNHPTDEFAYNLFMELKEKIK